MEFWELMIVWMKRCGAASSSFYIYHLRQCTFQYFNLKFSGLTCISSRSSCFLRRRSITNFCCSGVRSKMEVHTVRKTMKWIFMCRAPSIVVVAFSGTFLSHKFKLSQRSRSLACDIISCSYLWAITLSLRMHQQHFKSTIFLQKTLYTLTKFFVPRVHRVSQIIFHQTGHAYESRSLS